MTDLIDAEPRLLADLDWVLAQAGASASGAVWRLTEPDRPVEATLIRLGPHQRIDVHHDGDPAVLLLPIAGGGTLHAPSGPMPLTPHALVWLADAPHRAVEAGAEGVAFLAMRGTPTAAARPPLRDLESPRRLDADEQAQDGIEPPTLLPHLCPQCAAPGATAVNRVCTNCGALLAA